MKLKLRTIKLNLSQLLITVSLVVIFLGTILLRLPIATTDSIRWVDALFTSMSAFTLTGLTVVDVGETFTLFGQLIILMLVKFGGVGIMTFAILAFMVLGKKIGIKERVLLQQELNQDALGGIIKLVRNIFLYAMAIELVGMLILAMRWIPTYGYLSGLYRSFFYSVTALNNAGFSLHSDGLIPYGGDLFVNLIITTLFIIGGLGFTVLADLKNKKSFKKLSLHSKVMIIGTFSLNLVALLIFMLLEFGNPDTLGSLSGLEHQIYAAYFQVTTTRSAGFSTLPIRNLQTATLLFMSLLMFIGAGSTSAGGGIKLTTFLVVGLSSLSFIRGKKQITIGNRTLEEKVILRAFSILAISFLLIFSGLFILTITEAMPFLELLFEVISAFGTVGLSMGITAELSLIGRFVIMCLMFFGKIGPLTLAFSLAKSGSDKIRYPKEDLLTG